MNEGYFWKKFTKNCGFEIANGKISLQIIGKVKVDEDCIDDFIETIKRERDECVKLRDLLKKEKDNDDNI